MAVAVGVEQPAAGRAGIVSLDQQKTLKYLAMMVGCMRKGGNVKLLPTDNQRIKWLQEWVKAQGGPGYVKTAVQVSTPMLFASKTYFRLWQGRQGGSSCSISGKSREDANQAGWDAAVVFRDAEKVA